MHVSGMQGKGFDARAWGLGFAVALAVHAVPVSSWMLWTHGKQEVPVVLPPRMVARLLAGPSHLPPGAGVAVGDGLPSSTPRPSPARVQPPQRLPSSVAGVQSVGMVPLEELIHRSQVFAEQPVVGEGQQSSPGAGGGENGQETDPQRLRAGDRYLAQLGAWLRARWQYPSVISTEEASRLCAVLQVRIGEGMLLSSVEKSPLKSSGNPLFDASAQELLSSLCQNRIPLPFPPPESAAIFRNRTLQIALSGNSYGEGDPCR